MALRARRSCFCLWQGFFFSLAADEKLRTLLGEKTLLFQVSYDAPRKETLKHKSRTLDQQTQHRQQKTSVVVEIVTRRRRKRESTSGGQSKH